MAAGFQEQESPQNRAEVPGTFLTQLWQSQSVALAVTSTHQGRHKVPPRFKEGGLGHSSTGERQTERVTQDLPSVKNTIRHMAGFPGRTSPLKGKSHKWYIEALTVASSHRHV